jgi:hypothetical protein
MYKHGKCMIRERERERGIVKPMKKIVSMKFIVKPVKCNPVL